MDKIKKWQVLDGTMLKLIAMVSMAFDHVGACLFPEIHRFKITEQAEGGENESGKQ